MADPQEDQARDDSTDVRAAIVAMLTAFALFAVFYSEGATHFARDLPGNAVTDLLVEATDSWHALMHRMGPARLAPAVRDSLEFLRHLDW